MTPYLRAEARYRDDHTYHCLVDALTAMLAKLELTPVEMRAAAIYACIRFEHLNMNDMRRTYRQRTGPIPYREQEDMRGELDQMEMRASELRRWLLGDDEAGGGEEA